jgi:N-acyl-D-aspartate/D-glutamate deacylase
MLAWLKPSRSASHASLLGATLFIFAQAVGPLARQPSARFDTIVRHGTILDGTGGPPFIADVGITHGRIAAIGDLSRAAAPVEIEARRLFVAPGFINIHSHAVPDALPTAVNMLTQGVTTEILNADGGGPLDIGAQLARLAAGGLALNVGAFIGFNSAWREVMGDTDHRAGPPEIARLRGMIETGLAAGAWGVSSGLDYKPAYFAQTEEVVQVVEAARPWRTLFTNHDRITPESGFSSKTGMTETLAIGERSGLVPIVTHMKAQGVEQGTAGALLGLIRETMKRGRYAAADAYPYLAGQSGLGALIIPGWAQEGGREAMLKRFSDPAARARIVQEAEGAMKARFGGPQGVYLPRLQRELTDVMTEMSVSGGEAILRILEAGPDPGAILRFGLEDDVVKILRDPVTSMACDCGASTATRVHPRFYGSFPRVLGRYVREQKIMAWEEAIRKMSGLPAATIGMVDRGFLAVGMAADITVFDPETVIDHATFEEPARFSEGIRSVLVNGVVALRDGRATGERGGRTLVRAAHMPSRPLDLARARRVSLKTTVSGARLALDVSQNADARLARGTFELDDAGTGTRLRATDFGVLQTAPGWASVSGRAGDRSFTLIVDRADPRGENGVAAIVVTVEGEPVWTGAAPARALSLRP